MKVPQFSPWIGDEEYAAIADCFAANWITEGPKSDEFARRLLELMGAKYGAFAPNGTLALYLGLRMLGVGPGDEVIVPDFTFIASATSIEMCGARPIFVDVNRKNFQIDVTSCDRLVTERTKAIMPVHIYGGVADMAPVLAFAKRHRIAVIEDAAQAIGVRRGGIHAGTFGEVGCFSFFADKTITTGEGGFVVTNDASLYDKLLFLRNQGRRNRGSFIHSEIGYNFRMTDLQNAVGLVQLRKLDRIRERKEHLLQRYRAELEGVADLSFFEPDRESEFIPFRVGILTERGAEPLIEFMEKREVQGRGFFYPLHRQPCFLPLKETAPSGWPQEDATFPNTVYGSDHGVCLPSFPAITDAQIDWVCQVVREFCGAG